jgi:SNF2 family DNA or RNA helicase
VELSDELMHMFLNADAFKPQITVEENGSWLDVKFDIAGISEDEVDDVLQSVLAHEKYHVLKDGTILSLESDEFYETSEALKRVRGEMESNGGVFQLQRNQGLLLANELSGNFATEYSENFAKMIEDLRHPEKFEVAVPDMFGAVMREYQVDGLRWLSMLNHYQFGGVLADEMGLGKTLQAISFIVNNPNTLTLIVVPASLTYNWQKEFEKFAPHLNVQVMVGSVAERTAQFEHAKDADVLVTSYATLRQDIDAYKKLPIDLLFLDEAQYIKNAATKTTQALKKLKVQNRFALTGTPVENSVDELWSIFQMVLPGLFPSKPKFKKLSRETIAKTIQPFVLRREKEQVLKDLPEKIEGISYSELTEEQKKVYLAYLKRMQDDVAKMSDAELKRNKITILSMITRLRQICDDPRLVIDEYEGGSGKLEQLKETLQTAKQNGRRVLVFSQFTSMLGLIQNELDEMGLDSYYLHGGTKPKERVAMVDEFNSGERDVFLISLKAGGTGLNLTGADTVILYDLWWNPAVEEQATARAHRMGQTRVVEVFRMIAKGTIEEKIYALQQQKRDLFDALIQNTEQTAALSEEDIRTILNVGNEA